MGNCPLGAQNKKSSRVRRIEPIAGILETPKKKMVPHTPSLYHTSTPAPQRPISLLTLEDKDQIFNTVEKPKEALISKLKE
jgi:hypothetical protein